MQNTLYPIKLNPLFFEKIWGYESWTISTMPNAINPIHNGPFQNSNLQEIIEKVPNELLGTAIYRKYGKELPLLVKIINANQNLSIQVHPNDSCAQKQGYQRGKTEMWYILDTTDENAFIISGFNQSITQEEYVDAVHNNSLEDKLKKHPVKKGDIFYIPSGTVHAIGKGCVILEIQQACDITYRIYDYNRKDAQGNTRELHTDLAKEAIDWQHYKNDKLPMEDSKTISHPIINSPNFTTNLIRLNQTELQLGDTPTHFKILSCTKGHATLSHNGIDYTLDTAESILLPASLENVNLKSTTDCLLLETIAN